LNAQAQHDFVIGLSPVTPNIEFRHLIKSGRIFVSIFSTAIIDDKIRLDRHTFFVSAGKDHISYYSVMTIFAMKIFVRRFRVQPPGLRSTKEVACL
jgi:hypothetical protein